MVAGENVPAVPASRLSWSWLISIIVVAFVLRTYPFIAAGNAWRVPVDYDNGVYFSASALLWKNIWPYADYVFVHPPAILLIYSPIAAFAKKIDPAAAFVLARWMAAGVGALNTFLAGRAAFGLGGPWAALMAAAAYATHGEAIDVERGPFLEPALNLACLLVANLLTTRSSKDSRMHTLVAGSFAGIGLAIKLWGGIWLLAGAAAIVRRKSWQRPILFLAAGGLIASVVSAPFIARAPEAALQQILLFHLWRPPDGMSGLGHRLLWIFNWHPITSILGMVGAVLSFAPSRMDEERQPSTLVPLVARYWGIGYCLLIALFLSARTYWNQYNAHLAPAESILAGYAFAKVSAYFHRFRRPIVITCAAAAVALIPSLRHPLLSLKARDDSLIALGNIIRTNVPRNACLLSFEQTWAVVGGRLPQRLPNGAVWVDTYAAMLLDALKTGQRFGSAAEAFQARASQGLMRASLDSCRFAILGSRGDWQLSAETKSGFSENFRRRNSSSSAAAVDLWERR